MKRTVTLKNGALIYHRNQSYGFFDFDQMRQFKMLSNKKYVITITKDGQYSFKEHPDNTSFYRLWKKGKEICCVCKRHMHLLFFEPDLTKTYDITVKEVS